MITKRQIEELAAFDSGGIPVVSFYLNVDGRYYTLMQCVERTHQLVRQARIELPGRSLSKDHGRSVEQDLDLITRAVGVDLDRGDRRGLAIFGCAAQGFRRDFVLRQPVEDLLRIESSPYLRPLVMRLNGDRRYGVVLIDREKARIFVVYQDQIREEESVFDEVPSRIRVGTYYGLGDSKIERHIDDHVRQHLKHAAQVLTTVIERDNIGTLLLGGSSDDTALFLRALPRRLVDMVAGEVHGLMLIAPPDEVLARTMEVIVDVERRGEAGIVRRVRDAACAEGYGVIGLEATLRALFVGAVGTLVVERDLAQPGFRCARCARLFAEPGPCPECGEAAAQPVTDIVEAALETALTHETEIQFVSCASEWARNERIGGLLRFLPASTRSDAGVVTAS